MCGCNLNTSALFVQPSPYLAEFFFFFIMAQTQSEFVGVDFPEACLFSSF